MRSAPPVRVWAGIDPPWALAFATLAVAALAIVAAWAWAAWQAGDSGRGPWPLAATLGLAVCFAAWSLAALASLRANLRRGRWPLAWNGSGWQVGEPLPADPDALQPAWVRTRIDAGAWLLLQLAPTAPGSAQAGRRWAALHRSRHDPATWHALRCALYGRVPQAGSPAQAQPTGGAGPRA